MTASRRQLLRLGGGLLAALALPPAARAQGGAPHAPGDGVAPGAQNLVEIRMLGRDDGAHVWFDPIGVHLQPGQRVRWINLDRGNSHTATAYHPANFERALRMPRGAKPWDSDYLLPDESFTVTLTAPGVYDYYCVPHEHAGMVGRLVVGSPSPGAARPGADEGLPEVALKAFPAVEEILRRGIVRRA